MSTTPAFVSRDSARAASSALAGTCSACPPRSSLMSQSSGSAAGGAGSSSTTAIAPDLEGTTWTSTSCIAHRPASAGAEATGVRTTATAGMSLTAPPWWTGPRHARVGLDGGPQCPGEGLELRLDDVVRVAAREQPHVQGDRRVVGDRLEDVAGQRTGEVPADEVVLLAGGLTGVHEVGPAGQVHDGLGEGLVHGDVGVPEARDAALVPQRLAQRLAEGDRHVLHGVVDVDVRVTGRLHTQVDERVLAQRGEHVVVEGHGGGDVGGAGAGQAELDDDVRLRRRPHHTRRTRLVGHSPSTSCSAARKAAISSAVPIDTRSHPGGPTTRMRTPRSSSPCHTLSRPSSGPKRTKFASESAAVNPCSRSQVTVRSRSARSSAICAMRASRWRRAARATAWVTAERW